MLNCIYNSSMGKPSEISISIQMVIIIKSIVQMTDASLHLLCHWTERIADMTVRVWSVDLSYC